MSTTLIDLERPLVIDIPTKNITIPEGYNTQIGVVYEHNSNIITFNAPSTIEGQSLLKTTTQTTNCIIKWQNGKNKGAYKVTDLKQKTDDEENIEFSWILSKDILSAKGKLIFSVSFIIFDTYEQVVFKWSTNIFNNFSIGEGLYVPEIDNEQATETSIIKLETSYQPSVTLNADEEYINISLSTRALSLNGIEEHGFNTLLGQAYDGQSRKVKIQFSDTLPGQVALTSIPKKIIKWYNVSAKLAGFSSLIADETETNTFYWVVPKALMNKAGKVQIQICLLGFDENEFVNYSWASTVNSSLFIAESIYVENVDTNYHDTIDGNTLRLFISGNMVPEKLVLPDRVETISAYKFYKTQSINQGTWKCYSIAHTIGESAFRESKIEQYVGNPEQININAFYNCSNLTDIDLSGLKGSGLGDYCFCNTAIVDTGKIKAEFIPQGAFYKCTKLKTVELSQQVYKIHFSAFWGCISLEKIVCPATTPPTLDSTSLTGIPETCKIFVPDESIEAYKAAANWSNMASQIVGLSTLGGNE